MRKRGYNTAFAASLKKDGLPIRVGVYAIIIKDGSILMTHTLSGTKNILNFPGGGVDEGEGFAEALKRECLEELGMAVEIEKFLYASKDLYRHEDFPHSYMYNLYFLVKLKPNEIIEHAELEAEWFTLDNMPFDSMLPIDQEFMANFKV